MSKRILFGLLTGTWLLCVNAFAVGPSAFDRVIERLNGEGDAIASLIQREYGTRGEELKWAASRSLAWGEIAALAYIQATTGRSFEEMTQGSAHRDFWAYAETAEMSCDKMVQSLESFMKRAERERNSRIFERLRATRRVHALPDLGSGFGLFQEALDFRRIDSPRPTKIHSGPGALAKGKK